MMKYKFKRNGTKNKKKNIILTKTFYYNSLQHILLNWYGTKCCKNISEHICG